MLEIVHQCSISDGERDDVWFSCTRSTLTLIVCLLIIISSLYCIFKMYNFMKRLSFEIIPLLTTLIQAILQLIMTIFNQDMRILVSALYFQIFTFSIVSKSFARLYITIQTKKRGKLSLAMLAFQYLFLLYNLVLLILTLTEIIKFQCNDFFNFGHMLPIINLSFCTLICSIFGCKLLQEIQFRQSQEESKSSIYTIDGLNEVNANINKQDKLLEFDSQFLQDKIKQIKFIISTFILTVISQSMMEVVRQQMMKFNEDFKCFGKYRLQPINVIGEIYMIFYIIIQLVPCTLVPYAFYYLPLIKKEINNPSGLNIFIDKEPEDQINTRLSRKDTYRLGTLSYQMELHDDLNLIQNSSLNNSNRSQHNQV